MKSFAMSVVVAALLAVSFGYLSGCAHHRPPDVSLAAMQFENAPALTNERGAHIWRHRLPPNQIYPAKFPTLATVDGEGEEGKYHNFSVIFGLPAGVGIAPPHEQQQPEEAEARFKNPEPSWEQLSGYSYLWGWWPIGYTPFVRVGSEGRAALFILVESATRHRIVLLAGTKATVKLRPELGNASRDIATVGWAVDATNDNGPFELSAPYLVPENDPILALIEKLKPMQKLVSR